MNAAHLPDNVAVLICKRVADHVGPAHEECTERECADCERPVMTSDKSYAHTQQDAATKGIQTVLCICQHCAEKINMGNATFVPPSPEILKEAFEIALARCGRKGATR